MSTVCRCMGPLSIDSGDRFRGSIPTFGDQHLDDLILGRLEDLILGRLEDLILGRLEDLILESLEDLDDVKKKTINSANTGQPIWKSNDRGSINEQQWKDYEAEKMCLVCAIFLRHSRPSQNHKM